jgi:hypothetical protein
MAVIPTRPHFAEAAATTPPQAYPPAATSELQARRREDAVNPTLERRVKGL